MMFDNLLSSVLSWAVTGLLGLSLAALVKRYRTLQRSRIDEQLYRESTGLRTVYPSRAEAVRDQLDNLIAAPEIDYLSFNGAALLDAPAILDTSLMRIVDNWKGTGSKSIRALFLDPSRVDVITRRYQRIGSRTGKTIVAEGKGVAEDIRRNVRLFSDVASRFDDVTVSTGYFSSDLVWCLIIYGDSVLCSFYQEGTTAASARTLLIDRASVLGKSFCYYFEDLWEDRREVMPSQQDSIEA